MRRGVFPTVDRWISKLSVCIKLSERCWGKFAPFLQCLPRTNRQKIPFLLLRLLHPEEIWSLLFFLLSAPNRSETNWREKEMGRGWRDERCRGEAEEKKMKILASAAKLREARTVWQHCCCPPFLVCAGGPLQGQLLAKCGNPELTNWWWVGGREGEGFLFLSLFHRILRNSRRFVWLRRKEGNRSTIRDPPNRGEIEGLLSLNKPRQPQQPQQPQQPRTPWACWRVCVWSGLWLGHSESRLVVGIKKKDGNSANSSSK